MNETQAGLAKQQIVDWVLDEGFSAVGIGPAKIPGHANRFLDWLDRGLHGAMRYLENDPQARIDPSRILDDCRSVVCVALDYGGGDDPAAGRANLGRISRYAWGTDYHLVLKEKLKRIVERISQRWPGESHRIAVDTSPVLEKGFAAEAGIGWIGKHTNLIDPKRGSWFFLGEIFTTLALPPDDPLVDRCGDCTRCIEICPTDAIIEPYVLDARRCLSYWNIEHRGPIRDQIQQPMENWIFGCDLCQDVCPWNRDAPVTRVAEFAPRPGIVGTPLADWAKMTVEEYRQRFRNSAVKRARFDGMTRNIQIAAENAERRSQRSMDAMNEPVILYVARWSPDCRVARQFLERHGVAHRTVEIDDDPDVAAEAHEGTGSRLLPALRIGDAWVRASSRQGGFLAREVAARLGIDSSA